MRTKAILIIFIIILLLNSSCGIRNENPSNELTEVSVVLFWLPTVEFSGLWVAEQKGFYAEEGIHLTYQPWGEGVDPLKQVVTANDGIVLGFQDGASIIKGRAAGMPIKAIWAGTQRTPFGFLTLPKSNITTISDFSGRRIGYRPHELYVLETVLAHEGMSLDDITPVSLSKDPTPLLQGDVDVFLAYVTNTPIALQLQGINVEIIYANDYGYEFYGDVLFATDETITDYPDVLERFVKATNRGWQYALEHPDEIAQMVVDIYYPEGTVEHQTLQLEAFLPLATETGDFSDLGYMTLEKWQLGIDILFSYGQITDEPSADSIFTSQFLR